MNYNEYLAVIERRFRNNYSTFYDIEERGIKIDLFANSIFISPNIYKNKTSSFSRFEIYEKFYFKHFENINLKEIKEYFNFLHLIADEQLPSYQHLNKCVVGVLICDFIDENFKTFIQNLKYIKPFSLYFKGWSEIQFICIDLSANKIYFNNAAKPNIELFLF